MRQAVPDGPTQRGCQSAFAGAIRDEAAPRQGAPSPVRSADAARQAAAPLTYPPAHAAHRSAYGTAPGANGRPDRQSSAVAAAITPPAGASAAVEIGRAADSERGG